MHHARWMFNVIYSLKVWMCRRQFKSTQCEEQDMLIVATVYHVKYWIETSLSISSPRNDLEQNCMIGVSDFEFTWEYVGWLI